MTAARREQMLSYAVLGVFSVLVIYPMLSIVLLAFHKRSDLVTGFSIPDTLDFGTFKTAWEEGGFDRGLLNSFIVAATVTVVSAVLSDARRLRVRRDALPWLGHALLRAAARADLPVRGDGHPALLRVQGRRADRQPSGR